MKGVVVGAVIGAAVMFIWGFLFWGVLPIGNAAMGGVDNQAAFQSMLDEYVSETGVYMVPFSQDPSDAEFQALHAKGPIATVYYRAEGSEPMSTSTFVMGYLHELVVLLIMGLMLKLAGIASFGGRLVAVFLGGLSGAGLATLSAPIWWLHPWNMAVIDLIYQGVAWLLAGVVLATMVKPASRHSGVA